MTKTDERARRRDIIHPKVKIVLIYTLLGPPIGALITLVIFSCALNMPYAHLSGFADQAKVCFSSLFQLIGIALSFSYMFGGAQAFLTGLAIAAISSKDGRFGYGIAFAAPVFIGFVAGGFLFVWLNSPIGPGLVLGGVGAVASLIIRILFHGLFRRTV